ncbi:glycoside hydrolase family 13 protein [Actinomadura rubrisoli]|uniref:Glycoside hydrolase family 13 protein n=1 Tax=Actinomadura rubrisoli TaxID=2530368 RepID=A0A4R5AVX8_9ACTN|nr:glycoside hydrolase family 13 protein [Actinomadura rubrisoli]TDD76119.1 glycoside hydrolase family 13 protein [Actinomadura rubrisoli]
MTQDILAVPADTGPAGEAARWWRDAVIYQVYVRSFADSGGDGVGDLPGIRSRLPYLAGLGVDALWLTPFYVSPMADFGYDVADHRDVDPMFGTLDDARGLIGDAHARGLRVIVDVVPNHTSDRHAWFQAALAAPPGSPERARYVFRDGQGPDGAEPPNDWESVFGGPAWTRLPDGQWYLHLFAAEQPDLDWENPEVRAEFDGILRFWLDLGVDGFRVDVAHGLVKAPGLPDVGHADQVEMLGTAVLPYFDQDAVHDVHREWRRLLDSYGGERIAVAEAWAPTLERLALYTRPDELHQAFNFHYLTAPWDASGMRAVIEESLRSAESVGAPATWVLSNHDVKRHVTRYGGGEAGLRRARAAALLTLALPGSAYIYQGEELGLPEVLDLPEEFLQDPQHARGAGSGRDGCRVPLPWEGEEPPFGFGSGAASWLPIPPSWRDLTVAAQSADPGSMLALYREALRVRRGHPALGDGGLRWLVGPPGTLFFVRETTAGGGARRSVACAVNMSGRTVRVPTYGTTLLASGPVRADGDCVALPPDTALWWDVEDR